MKIAISSQGNTLDSEVDPRFGRCAYFIIVDPDTMEWEALSNEAAQMGGGAGVKAAQLAADKGAEVLITGNCGPNAFQSLRAAQIRVFIGASGRIRDVIDHFQKGQLTEITEPSVGPHFGMR